MRRCEKQNHTHIEVTDSFWVKSFRGDDYIGIVTAKNLITDEINVYVGYGKENDLRKNEESLITDGNSLILNGQIDYQLRMILIMFYVFNKKMDYEKLKKLFKECGFEKYIKDIEIMEIKK